MTQANLLDAYSTVKLNCNKDWTSSQTGESILHLAVTSLNFLNSQCEFIDLVSKVRGKSYGTYRKDRVVARPANLAFFLKKVTEIKMLWKAWIQDRISEPDFAKLSYTIALAPCLAMEIFDRQNKKGPATSFEWFIGHLVAKATGVNPTKTVRLPVQGESVRMTMDFLFDLGSEHRKVHVPVKMSTRERVVQAWAHQRLLEAAYGAETYRGIMICFSETKLDSRKLEVVEICVPDQWLAYQALLAKMDRIYYFDVPARYQALTEKHSEVITIRQFGKFFSEREEVLHS